MLRVRDLIESEIDDSSDSVVTCFLGREEQCKENMLFLGRRGYTDMDIPTVI